MVQRFLILLLISLAITTRVHSQLDANGFVSIDCGLSGTPSYVDSSTNLTYVSDEQFIDTGISSQISSSYGDNYPREYLTLRSFPTGTRNCYTIKSLIKGSTYLVRTIFFYANYDNLNKAPKFDVYLGTSLWTTVNADSISFPEIIFRATADYLDVCLVNTNHGVPFITSIHLRQFDKGMYPYATSRTSLNLVERYDMGASSLTRYPDDKYDRWWWNYTETGWDEISFNSGAISNDDKFQTPLAVLRTAVTSSSTQQLLTLRWKSDRESATNYILLHFYDQKPVTGRRQFRAIVNGDGVDADNSLLEYDGWGWIEFKVYGYTYYNITLVATSVSTLPPLLNAFELYTAAGVVGDSTNAEDVSAINDVKVFHKIKKGWSGDPCYPEQFSWTGIKCSGARITELDLSHSNLTGPLSESIGHLTSLESLLLSYNSLSGSLSSLDNLKALTLLDITGNPNMSSDLPPELKKRQQSGSLDYKYKEPTATESTESTISKYKKPIAAVAGLLLLAFIVGTVMRSRRRARQNNPVYVQETIEIVGVRR